MDSATDLHDSIKAIKQQFFARRNGILADTLRKGGMTQKTIFGLMVPDIAAIARLTGQSMQLADALWADSDVRESRILACYLFPPREVSPEKALSLALDVANREEADMLGFRLMRNLPFAADIASQLEADAAPLSAYMATAIRRHLE